LATTASAGAAATTPLVVDVVLLSPQLARATISVVPAIAGAVTRLDKRICFSASICPTRSGRTRRDSMVTTARLTAGCDAVVIRGVSALAEPEMDRRLRTPRTPALCSLRQGSRRRRIRCETRQRAAQSEVGGREGVGLSHSKRNVVRGPMTKTSDSDQRCHDPLARHAAVKANRAVAYRAREVLNRTSSRRGQTYAA